ncbi:hypothetical protein HJC23_002926 [Cyclotella cryptica]|uniref:DNA replication complex GINS protein PSF3 n=1 Tax=Cyclotella cryptica TaxID=29204 RepID=A0ABD3PQ67_9STRA
MAATQTMPSYYDIDTILAEEELIQIRPSFPFSHLSHLDPEHRSRKRRRVDKENVGNANRGSSVVGTAPHVLEEGAKIKMPMWAVDRWVVLGFVTVTLPGVYGRKMKERLQADPVSVDLGTNNTHYFLSGLLLASLLQRASQIAKRHRSRSASSPALQLSALAQSLRYSLLNAMMGDRLRRNFDWTLSALDAMEDDASGHVGRLSVLEKLMFEKGVESSGAVVRWREGGSGRIAGSKVVVRG